MKIRPTRPNHEAPWRGAEPVVSQSCSQCLSLTRESSQQSWCPGFSLGVTLTLLLPGSLVSSPRNHCQNPLSSRFFFFNYLWLHCIFVDVTRLSLVVVHGLLIVVAPPVVEHQL